MKRTWALALLPAATLLACGGGDETVSATPDVVVQAATDTTPATVAGNNTAAADSTDEERALAFTECMRSEGVDMADPTVAADGSVSLTPPGGANGTDPSDEVVDAFDACSAELDGASFLPSDNDLTELEDQLLDVAQCLRDEGLDVDDPDLGGGIRPGLNPFGDGFDPNDPASQDAIEICQELFTGITPGGPNS